MNWSLQPNDLSANGSKFTLPRESSVGKGLVVGPAAAEHMRLQGYQVMTDEEIGRGAYGVIYKAKMVSANVACKVQASGRTNPQEIAFLRLCLFHKSIIVIFAVFEPHPRDRFWGKVYIFMELMPNNLEDYVKANDGLDENEARFLFQQIASGVEYLHSNGWTHCDLKAANVLLDEAKQVAKLTDFGTCLMDEIQSFNSQADVVDLGATLYFMVGGNKKGFSRVVSEEVKEFIRYIKTDKPTASEVLEHVWMSSGSAPELLHEPQDVPQLFPEISEAFDRLVHQDQPSVTLTPSGRDHRDQDEQDEQDEQDP